MNTIKTLLLLCLIAVVATPCVRADENPLRDALPERWTYTPQFIQQTPDDEAWWRTLFDPLLDTLVQTGVRNNFNVAAALQRIESARAQVGIARSSYWPSVGVDASWQKTRTSGATVSSAGRASTMDYFSVGASASWEIDIFGKVREGVRQKQASWRASRAEYTGVMVSMAAEIATTYIELRVAQSQMIVAREHLESQKHIVDIAQARHDAGLASALDVSQAKAVYYSTVSTIPALENSIHAYLNSLAVLLGVYKDDLPRSVVEAGPLPGYDVVVATGVPADLLRRRPDIVEAEQQLAAAAAGVGIAKKDFLPALSINGSVSTSAHKAGDIFRNNSFGYSIAPTLSWTLFSGFARKYAVAEAKAQMEAAIDSYNLTVMNAVAEADNAMYNYGMALKTIESLNDVVTQSSKSLELSIDLYKSGNSGFTDVANAQMSLLSYTNQWLTARGSALESLINLYRALGGGWQGL